MLEAPGAEIPTAARATALLGAGMLEFRQGDDDQARVLFEEALAVAREVRDTASEARALNNLSRVALRGREPARVLVLAREAWGLYERVGDSVGVATSRHMTAAAMRMTGDYAGAAQIYAENLQDARVTHQFIEPGEQQVRLVPQLSGQGTCVRLERLQPGAE